MKKIKLILLLMFALAIAGCKSADRTHVAVLGDSANEEEIKIEYPESKIIHFKSPSEFLLSLAIGKCDVGIVDRESPWVLMVAVATTDSGTGGSVVGGTVSSASVSAGTASVVAEGRATELSVGVVMPVSWFTRSKHSQNT